MSPPKNSRKKRNAFIDVSQKLHKRISQDTARTVFHFSYSQWNLLNVQRLSEDSAHTLAEAVETAIEVAELNRDVTIPDICEWALPIIFFFFFVLNFL